MAILLLFSCTPDPIDIEIPSFQPKLVVASQIIPNQVMVVGLSMSFSALSNAENQGDTANSNFLDSVLVEHALVTVSYSGKTDTLYKVQPGIYVSLNTLQQDYGVYTLYVKDSVSGNEVTATSVILPKVSFDNVTPIITKNPGDTVIQVQYSFTDIPGVDNWYVVNYYVKKPEADSTSFDLNTFNSIGSSQLLSSFELLSDKTFGGPAYSKTTTLEGAAPSDTIAVAVSNISEGYYKFLTAYKRTRTILNQLTGEPITYPSNVYNGYGYFSTHYPDIRVFDLKQY